MALNSSNQFNSWEYSYVSLYYFLLYFSFHFSCFHSYSHTRYISIWMLLFCFAACDHIFSFQFTYFKYSCQNVKIPFFSKSIHIQFRWKMDELFISKSLKLVKRRNFPNETALFMDKFILCYCSRLETLFMQSQCKLFVCICIIYDSIVDGVVCCLLPLILCLKKKMATKPNRTEYIWIFHILIYTSDSFSNSCFVFQCTICIFV